MAEVQHLIQVSDYEQRLMVNGLNAFRNDLIREGKPTEDINALLIKVIDAPDKLSRQNCVLYVCGIVPVVWLALLAAPLLEGGLGTLLEGFGTALENPFHIVWCDKSLKTLLIFLMLYGLGIGVYVSNERVYRRREEQGSARWGNPLSIAKRYQQSGNANKLLTQQVALGLDGRKHHRNLNVLICGGSGAGKTRFYAKPSAPVRAV